MNKVILLVLLSAPIFASAQRKLVPMDPDASTAPRPSAASQQVFKSSTIPVIQSTGKRINEEAITRYGGSGIDGIANTVGGVQQVAPGQISIRGAGTAGTAYFVDGVRIYGALPIITR